MLHLFAEAQPEEPARPYAEAVSRLASVRHALRLIGPFGSGPAPDHDDDEAIAAAWESAGEKKRELFDRRSERLVNAAAAGIEALLVEREDGREPNWAASDALIAQIRRELEEVAGIILA
jgi:hypothetical protein